MPLHGFARLQWFPVAQASQVWALSAMWSAAMQVQPGVGVGVGDIVSANDAQQARLGQAVRPQLPLQFFVHEHV